MVAAPKVLIVEDERIVRLHLRITLQELGYEVTGVASSAEEAVRSAEQTPPELVLMDVRLEGGPDGIEAARQLRARHDLTVVFLTAFADEDTVRRTQEIGAGGFIAKPFSKPQLRATLSTAILEHGRRRQSSLAAARLRASAQESALDPARALRPFGEGTRLALFSHDTMGLGHLQRNLNIAGAISRRFPGTSILLLTGSPVVHRFPLPPRVDYVKLPSVRKVASENYSARELGLSDDEVLRFRSNLALRSIRDFDPHVLLVDHAPMGMKGELLPALEWLDRKRPNCIKIAGLRDVLDGPERVKGLWRSQGVYGVLDELYDHVLVYGSPEVFDPVSAYEFPPALARKTFFSNYIRREPREGEGQGGDPFGASQNKRVVVTIGGGDGYGEEVLGTYLKMLRRYQAKIDFDSVLLTGPFLDPKLLERFREEAEGLPVTLEEFVQSTKPYLESSDLVVSTCGYNTMVETLCFGRRALIIPRRMHRLEQVIRAEQLAKMGMVERLLPEEVSPEELYQRMRRLLDDPAEPLSEARAAGRLGFDGAERIADFLGRLRVDAPRL